MVRVMGPKKKDVSPRKAEMRVGRMWMESWEGRNWVRREIR